MSEIRDKINARVAELDTAIAEGKSYVAKLEQERGMWIRQLGEQQVVGHKPRFGDLLPKQAVVRLLEETGAPLLRRDIVELVIAGGAKIDAKSDATRRGAVKSAIGHLIGNGDLTLNGKLRKGETGLVVQDGDSIGLDVWVGKE